MFWLAFCAQIVRKFFEIKKSWKDTENETMDKICINAECKRIATVFLNYQKLNSELNSKVLHQKKTLKDYRDQNVRSFDEIAQLEVDIKDKEDFINKLKKERNELKRDVKFLNDKVEAKNKDLMKIHLDSEDYVKTSKAT